MTIQVSKRALSIKPSPTLAVTARAKELKAAGKDIIGLGAGEPDFDTPEHIKKAAIDAIKKGFTKYTAAEGTPELKQAIIAKFQRDNALAYKADQILVSCGAKHSLYNLAQALLNPGDEVIIPAPYWVSYPDIALLAGAVPVIVSAGLDQGFKISAKQLESAITSMTRLVVINSPSNPTGVGYTRKELSALANVLKNHPKITIVSDDIYEHIWWADDPFCNILNVCPELYNRTLVVNGVSKSYSMTGWRIGYTAGPANVIKAMANIQSQSTSNPTSIAQVAAQAALEGDQGCIQEMVVAFKKRHDFVVAALNDIDGVECLESQGAFYSFPNMREVIKKLDGVHNDLELAEYLINEANVALVPGSAFGAPGYMRLSFATDMKTLEKAMQRLKKALTV
ncbi:MAG: aspartate aminotransferase [Gammaproteobacteria bacterium]|nr:MAG: aspartate aminotransferase [Gammaproteobacteria bacterium]TND06993.1 MAG: aspartate aminotransferase [Gammaproteobacteria bacterium]